MTKPLSLCWSRPDAPIDRLMDRLAELAAGAEPWNRDQGICGAVTDSGNFWSILSAMFIHMGLNASNPLGDIFEPGDHWSGRRGQRRRKLCYDLLVQFVASAGYQGRYR